MVDLLIGSSLIPEGLSAPILRVVSGPTLRTYARFADGSEQIIEGLDPEAAAALRPLEIQLQSVQPALRKISLAEIDAVSSKDEDPVVAEAKEALFHETDIAIWCTHGFSEAEYNAWQALPDLLKNQGILLRTHVDLAPDPVAELAALDERVGHEFERVLPIATGDALAARTLDGHVDKPAFRASGGQGVISTVLKLVERTRQGLVDQADFYLRTTRRL